jgi:short-subunit dehydrogenase
MPAPLNEQVVVITGASSGIGRETAIHFGRSGATVVAAARNEVALRELTLEVERAGGRALPVICDVADWEQVTDLAREALSVYGRIDTWVNNASVSIFGLLEDMSIEEIERVMQVNFMGVVHGCKAVLPHMRQRGTGTIINVGSAVSYRAVPLQTPYASSKHAVKAFTDGLRMELEHENANINVTLIAPASINTPFFANARTKMGVRGRPIPPVLEPHLVAEAILSAAAQPKRDIFVGSTGKVMALGEAFSPAMVDRMMLSGDMIFRQQQADAPPAPHDNLFSPVPGPGSVSGEWQELASAHSPFTRAMELHPTQRRMVLGAAALGLVLWMRSRD